MDIKTIKDLPSIDAADLADWHEIVDVSDLTDSPEGTSKKVSNQSLLTLFNSHLQLSSPSQVTGLGSIATQSAGSVNITGGAINNTVIGNTTPAVGKFTNLSANSISAYSTNTDLTLSGNGTGAVSITGGLLLPTAGGTPSKLDYFEEDYTHNTYWTSLFSPNAGPSALKITRINKIVHIKLPEFSATSVASGGAEILMVGPLPPRFVPAINQYCPVWAINNNAISIGAAYIQTDGTFRIRLGVSLTSNFIGSATCGFKASPIHYSLG